MDWSKHLQKNIALVAAVVIAGSTLPFPTVSAQEPQGSAQAQAVVEEIGDLGCISLGRSAEVARVRASYNALSPEDKAAVGNYQRLLAAEKTLDILRQRNGVTEPATVPTAATQPRETGPRETEAPTEPPVLLPAAGNPKAQWPSFRADAANNGVIHSRLPRMADRTLLLWENVYGLGYPSPLTLVDDSLYSVHGGFKGSNGTVSRLTLEDGGIQESNATSIRPSDNSLTPVYGDNRIFCLLNDGVVQAFDCSDLKSLWIYKDPAKGKSQSPITYHDGRLYMGVGSGSKAAFLCLDAKTGKKLWREPVSGGMVHAGALVLGDFVVYGNESGQLTVRNKDTGKEVQKISVSRSPIRSAICYAEGKLFFTTRDAHLYYANFHADTGAVDPLTSVDCSEFGKNCYSTPTVYDSFVYLTVGSDKESQAICVDTLTDEVSWNVKLGSGVKGSPILTDAYREQGLLYLYVSCRDGLYVVEAQRDGSGAEAHVLFASEAHGGAASGGIIADREGNLYFTNDSSAIFALGRDEAYLDSITGTPGGLVEKFSPKHYKYHYLVEPGTESVQFEAETISDLTLNGGKVSEPVKLKDGKATAEFVVTDEDHHRTYTVEITEKSRDATLKDIVVTHEKDLSKKLYLVPSISRAIQEYGVYTVEPAAAANSVNVFPVPEIFDSQVQLFAVSNVRDGGFDKDTGEIPSTLSDGTVKGFKVPFADQNKPIVVKIHVKAEAGDEMEYTLTLSKAESRIDAIGPVTPERKSWITNARNTYDFLTEAQKSQISNYDILEAAEKKLAELEK